MYMVVYARSAIPERKCLAGLGNVLPPLIAWTVRQTEGWTRRSSMTIAVSSLDGIVYDTELTPQQTPN